MRIYLAAPWADRDKMEATYSSPLEEAGHSITHKWWKTEDRGVEKEQDSYNRQHAELDVMGVQDCEIMVLVNSVKSEGKAVEQGIALAQNKIIIAIGKRGETSLNVFHFLPNYVWVPTISEAIAILDVLKLVKGRQLA